MFKLSKTSKERLETCDQRLQEIVKEVLKSVDVSVLCGHRGEKEQTEAFNKGTSKAKFGESLHNVFPSKAVDIVPYPIPRKPNGTWDDDSPEWTALAKKVVWIAHEKRIPIRWGGHFRSLIDKPHFEIVGD